MRRVLPGIALGGALLLACEDDATKPGNGPPPTKEYDYQLVEAFPNLSFARPVDVQHAGDGTNRVFVVEQLGRILVFPNDPGATTTSEFLNLVGTVTCCGETGLLGLAFHPQYETNGYFFVHYSTNIGSLHGRVSRFQVSAGNPNAADPLSESVLLEFQDDYGNHNGGAMFFGGDGYLYVAIGDEGGGGDLDDNAQDLTRIFGKILRLDVDQNVGVKPFYGIPPDNPFAGNSNDYLEEIFAYGLRNPWRVSYDSVTDRIIAGDVGQGTWEEIDVIIKGGNYGWDCREGLADYDEGEDASSPLCASATGLIDPIWVYPHSVGQSITGGYVYRGPTVSSLVGKYVYADYMTGLVWALDIGTGTNEDVTDAPVLISTFGVLQDSELIAAGYSGSGAPRALYRIEETEVAP